MRKKRFRQTTGCTRCDKEVCISVGECCPDCGGTFMGNQITHQYIVEEHFIPIETVWYKPSTWKNGEWQNAKAWNHLKEKS